MRPARLEELEPRKLFLIDTTYLPVPPDQVWITPTGTLNVIGGEGDNELLITRNEWAPDRVEFIVHYRGGNLGFPAATVHRIYIDGGLGNDSLHIDESVNVPATLVGGDGDDTLIGAQHDEWLIGEAGNDVIRAGGGNDVVHAGAGDDTVYGDDGNDTILGLAGNDVLFGGWGQDNLDGGRGGDHLLGEDSNDFLEGGPDNDILDGGAGTDTLYGGDGNDYLIGGRGVGDSMRGGMGNDKFRADDFLGNGDSMWGEAGFDVLVSDADADDLFVRGPQTR
jgi:Ca2+-binding RTX toxin-like protein